MDSAEKANGHPLVPRVLDEYKRTGKTTTRLAPNVTRVLDVETQAALEQISQGQQISQEQVKVIVNKTRKLTQRLNYPEGLPVRPRGLPHRMIITLDVPAVGM